MADALLTDLSRQLASTIAQLAEQEIEMLVGVDEEVQKLQAKLGFIKAILDDAEKRHAVKRDTEKLWLEQLQDKYYEMDDILDTWSTAWIKAEIEKEEGKPDDNTALAVVKKVRSFFPSLSRCFNLPLRHDLGHKIKKLNEKLDEILNDKDKYGIDFNRQPEVVERPRTTSFVDESDVIGRDRYREDLLSVLLGKGSPKERNPHVISLVGMGGLGKTTLAQIAYNNSEVKKHFVKRMWVCVSDPFDQCKVAKAIIESLEGQSPNAIELQSLLDKLYSLIGGERFFLVLDDVWTENVTKWEPFKNTLKCGAKGSRILVTTRKSRVANMMESSSIIDLGELSPNDCWLIIKKIAFFDDYGEQYRDLEELGKQLANKCKGLPLAAKILGSYLRGKMSKEEWEKVLHNDLWKLEDFENGLLGPFFLSYYELSPSEKQCFLFCAVFPKDYQFNKFELIIHWMAQGYIHLKGKKGKKEMEDIAEEYFEKLAMCSFFQDFEKDKNDDKITSCKMHDIVHDFAQLMAKDVFSTIEGEEEVKIDFKRARHLSLIVKETFPESVYEAKNLHTLFLCSRERYYECNMHLSCHHFRCLRTLILDCPFTEFPNAVENLIHLRCLHIYENVRIEELPETLCNLCNLQTLNIDNCGVLGLKKLPKGIGKLINLRQLRFKTSIDNWRNIKFPNGIGKLTCLRTLSGFNMGGKDDKEGCKLGELKNLNQLRGSFEINRLGNVVDVGEAQNAQLKKKIHLHDLKLSFFIEYQLNVEKEENRRRIESDVAILNALEPPPDLEKLSIDGVMGITMYTNWITSLNKLKSLDISNCCLLECLPPLGKLPLLKELKIHTARNVKKLGDEFLGIESENKSKKDNCHIINIFPNLRVLEISHFHSCEEWIGMGGKRLEVEEEKDSGLVSDPIIKIMPRLESLTIKYCNKLKCLPDYLRTTPLQKLHISYCRNLKPRCEREEGDCWPIISHIPTIKIGFNYVQRNGQPPIEYKGIREGGS